MTRVPQRRLSSKNWRRAYQARSGFLSFFRARWARLQEFLSGDAPIRRVLTHLFLRFRILLHRRMRLRCTRSAIRVSSSGFTMLEILAVIAIFMILLAMVLYPASRWHRQQRIRSAVAVVQSAMRLAREQAMTRRESVSVFFRNEVASNRIVRSFYWIHGDQSQNLGLTNTIPNGVSFFFYEPLYSTGSPNTLAVCITGDSVTGGDWVVFTTNEFPISFTPSGIATSSLIVGVAESAPPGGGLALTGLVSVAGPSSGYITTDPAMP